jgi:endonuclease-3
MKKEAIAPFFATLKAANPMPVTELEYTSVFELLAAVLLSAQATDVSVNKATRKLYPVANTPQAILDLGWKVWSRTSAPSGCTAPRPKTCWRPARYW